MSAITRSAIIPPVLRRTTALFALTTFVGSALLFVVQPMIAKMVLPLLGGAPAVWNTCMVFFQACLLIGYAYAHLSIAKLGVRRQAILHVAIVAAALLFLPLRLPVNLVPPATGNPSLWLLAVLARTIAVPFIVVSSMAPLAQKWFAHAARGADEAPPPDPYFLYGASNVGSMLALLSYPLLVEPRMDLGRQTRTWTQGYWLLLALILIAAIVVWRRRQQKTALESSVSSRMIDRAVTWSDRAWWLILSFVPASYLLGVTSYITTDVAAVPLLWVVPLALYLLTFILVFSRRPLLPHRWMLRLMPFTIAAVVLVMLAQVRQPIGLLLGVHLLAFFVAAMVCHGELVARRPDERHLTEFYLVMSLGGVIGGVFNALVAPLIFQTTFEYPLVLVLALAMRPAVLMSVDQTARAHRNLTRDLVLDILQPLVIGGIVAALLWPHDVAPAVAALLLGVPLLVVLLTRQRRVRFASTIAVALVVGTWIFGGGVRVLEMRRSFFGVHRLVRNPTGPFNELYHGTTLHGRQFIDPTTFGPILPREPLTYYHRTGPLGDVFLNLLPRRQLDRPLQIGAVGLGTGSVAAYAEPGSRLTFFEIDPLVQWFADHSGGFSFLGDARARGANVDVVLGDARLTIQRVPDRAFDVLVLDAFSGDAIPVHLLTAQAFEIYLRKVRDDGLILVHVSNQYLDLRPIVANLADHAGRACVARLDDDKPEQARYPGKTTSLWLVLTRDAAEFAPIAANGRWLQIPRQPDYGLWTDEFSDVVSLLRWGGGAAAGASP